jgi:hypothetical protein
MQTELRCASCGRVLALDWHFRFQQGEDCSVLKCLRCALRHRPLVWKALATSLVVGSILTLINQGDALLGGHFTPLLLWKVPLTYFVPYAVATYSALAISRTHR